MEKKRKNDPEEARGSGVWDFYIPTIPIAVNTANEAQLAKHMKKVQKEQEQTKSGPRKEGE